MANSTPDLDQLAQDAARIVQAHCTGNVARVELIARGVMTHKFWVSTDQKTDYIVRFYPLIRSDVVRFEPDLLQRCALTGAMVPIVVVDSRNGPAASLNYVVYHKIPGEPASSLFPDISLEHFSRELVAQFDLLGTVKFSGFGELIDAGHGQCPSWPAFVTDAIRGGMRAIEDHRLVIGQSTHMLPAVAVRIPSLIPNVAPALVWADVGLDNILVNPTGGIAGLLDFEGVLSGDGLLTLGYCQAMYDRSEFFMRLAEAWTMPLGPAEWQRIDAYTVLRALRVIPHHIRPFLPNGTPRSPIHAVFPGVEPAIARLSAGSPSKL